MLYLHYCTFGGLHGEVEPGGIRSSVTRVTDLQMWKSILCCRLSFRDMPHVPNKLLLELDNESGKLVCSVVNTAV